MPGAHVFSLLQTVTQLTREVRRVPHNAAEFLDDVKDYAFDHGPRILGILFVSAIAWWMLRGIARRLSNFHREDSVASDSLTEQRARTAAQLVRNAGHFVITVVAILSIANALGLGVGPFLASAGVLGLAISFGSQSLVRDFVTGFFFQLEQQFVLGDTVRVGTFEGTVERVTLRLVYLRDATGALHIIPNGSIVQVTNLSRTWGRVAVDVDIAWADGDRAHDVLQQVVHAFAGDKAWDNALLEKPQLTGIEKFNGGIVTYRIIARVVPSRRDEVARELRFRAKRALDVAKVRTASPPMLAPVL
jgi:moderate conductance mechanosensitive channel